MPVPWGSIIGLAGGLLGLGRTPPAQPLHGGDLVYSPVVMMGGGGPSPGVPFAGAGQGEALDSNRYALPYYPIAPLPVPNGWQYDYASYADSVTDIARAAVEPSAAAVAEASGVPWSWVAAGLGAGLLVVLAKSGKGKK